MRPSLCKETRPLQSNRAGLPNVVGELEPRHGVSVRANYPFLPIITCFSQVWPNRGFYALGKPPISRQTRSRKRRCTTMQRARRNLGRHGKDNQGCRRATARGRSGNEQFSCATRRGSRRNPASRANAGRCRSARLAAGVDPGISRLL
jgi:hypothetical protein